MRLLLGLTWRTTLARPTLSVLTALLLAIATALLYGLLLSAGIISSLRDSFTNELSIEVELSDYSDSTRSFLADGFKQRADVISVLSLSSRDVLEEVEQELGESLRDVLTDNPFPPILRVKLRNPSPERIELFVDDISAWPNVLQVVYPRELWGKFDAWLAALRGKFAFIVGALAFGAWVLAGLSLRAILRNRRSAWELLSLVGIRPRDLEWVQLMIEVVLGLAAGLLAVGMIHAGLIAASWLLLTTIEPPTGWFFGCIGTALLLAVLAGVWAPRLTQRS